MTSAPLDLPPTGARDLVGYDIKAGEGDSETLVSLTVSAAHLNRVDSLHGGIASMLLDTAMGVSASRYFSAGGSDVQVLTLQLNTDFIAAPRAGTRVVAFGQVDGGGRKICYAKAELRGADDGMLYARATSVLKRLGNSSGTLA